MQLLFGVTGRGALASQHFSRLKDHTTSSNPGVEVSTLADDGLALGHAVRHFVSLSGDDPSLAFHLDGEIRSLGGVDVPSNVAGEALFQRLAADFRRDPVRFWEHLDGSFCLIVRDGPAISVGVDVAGTRSMYWWTHEGILAFHSHLADLAPAFPDPLTEDEGALGSFLGAGIYPPQRTAFREIAHLGPGQFLRFEDGRARARNHLGMVYEEARPTRSRDQLVDELIELVDASVARTQASMDLPVVPLSGGLDSRYLLAELARHSPDPTAIKTITWGVEPDRPACDAVVAAEVAAVLGVENTWFEKPQQPTPETFARAIYLSSGEADCAIHFPDDHILHAQLAAGGYRSLLRGDEAFGNGPRLLTRRAVFAVNGIARLSLNTNFEGLIEPGRLQRMGSEQDADLAAMLAGIRSRTPTGARDEIRYQMAFRRVLAPYNRVKHADLEVFTPFLDRSILEWLRGTPDRMRFEKGLLRAALPRRFPRLESVPFAVETNLPRWDLRWRHQPALARFYRDWCATPGWLDAIGSQAAVVANLDLIERAAADSGAPHSAPDGIAWKAFVKRTLPGRALRELTLERRYHAPAYECLARLAVLHQLIGDIQRRASKWGSH